MFIVGLTGGIGSGKSTVSQMIREMGVDVIDADLVAREVVRPGMKAWKDIRKHFGNEVIEGKGEINRQKLAEIIFNDKNKRQLLNGLTHPQIYKHIFKQLLFYLLMLRQFVVLDLPLLYESGKMTKYMSKVIVVKCSRDQQIQRLSQRNGYSESESISRIDSQMALEDKCRLSDYVIDNSNDLTDTRRQVEEVIKELRSSYKHWRLRIVLFVILLIGNAFIVFLIKQLFAYFVNFF